MDKPTINYIKGFSELSRMSYKVNKRSFLCHAQVHENRCITSHKNNRNLKKVINIFIELKPKVGGKVWRLVTRRSK